MNLKRGFFRVWIVASSIWIALILIRSDLSYEIKYAYSYHLRHEVFTQESAPDSCRWEIFFNKNYNFTEKTIKSTGDEASQIKECIQNYKLTPPNIKKIIEPLALATLPPTLGLSIVALLGYLIFLIVSWVRRGFKN